jgi:GMP synthase-like glutamine amidotransferase
MLEGIDLLIALGGPMSANDKHALPWLADEKAFIREAVEEGIAVVGIRLGAQFIAAAMGARVYPNPEKEIGWFPVYSAGDPGRSVFRFPPSFIAFHWHGDTFDLPDGAGLLARSAACGHQAFQLGDRTIGLQFHLETTREAARELIVHAGDELLPARYVQSEEDILAVAADTLEEMHVLMIDVLEYVTRH